MGRSFTITTPATDVRADASGHAEAVFTVTNTTFRPIRGMAKAEPLGDTKREWLRIEGETERDFAAGATHQFTVTFDAPVTADPKGGTSTGDTKPVAGSTAGTRETATAVVRKYQFRLSVFSALRRGSDEDFTEGPTVSVEVVAAGAERVTPWKFPLWIIPVIAVALIGIAITSWLLLRTKQVEVPNVVGKPIANARSILSDGKLKANVKERVTGKVPEGRVAEQSPEAGRVPEGSTVELVEEAARPVPTQRINVALGKTTTQSSTVLAALSSRAVDGNTSGNWADNSVTHTQREANAWWQVDLGAVQSIVEIKNWNRTDCCPERLSNFYVLVSSAPFTSTDLNSTISQPGVSAFPAPSQAGTPTTITVGKPGRFVRVQLVGTEYLSLAEVQVIADVPNVAWASDGGKQQIVASVFRPGDLQCVIHSDALLSIVLKPNSLVVLSKSKRPKPSGANLRPPFLLSF